MKKAEFPAPSSQSEPECEQGSEERVFVVVLPVHVVLESRVI